MNRRFSFVASLAGLLALFVVPTPRAQAPSDADIVGLWFYQTHFPIGLEGELTLTREGDDWVGAIAGSQAKGTPQARTLRLQFPNDGGALRGVADASGRLQSAFWIRREMTDDPRYPEGAAQSYATPLALRAVGADRWQATVKPLRDPFTLYLNIFRDESGTLKAAIRNPEHHRHGPAMQLIVTRSGDGLRFGAKADPAKDDLEATLMRDPPRIVMRWAGIDRTIQLTRATPAQTALFTARPRNEPRYVYRMPKTLGDGWRVARANSLGVDEQALERAVQRIIDIDPSSARAWLIHSMAVAYRGRLILDEYFYGHGPDVPHDMRSASKTFSSVIMGAAMMDGAKISPQTRLYEVMAPLGPFANPDPRKARITLAHAMTHSAGFACDDNVDGLSNEDIMQSQREQPNWVKFTLDLPMAYEPGTHYAYCSANINLVGGALTMATGEWLPALFDRTLARPLNFGTYHWNLMSNGEGYVGGGAFVRPRDFLKLGQTFLDGGVWNGRRIVTEAWVKDSLAPHMRISPETTGKSGNDFASSYYDTDEGYAWHMIGVRSGNRTYPAYHGNGNGGQLVLVVPQFDLAVMFTAGNYRQGLWNRERDDITGEMIIPALRR
jgi:CubicO group peptidase (beta-lactamase class C family)